MTCTEKSACCFYKVAIVVIAILISLYLFQQYFPYLFYLRVPLLSGLLLLALPVVCLFALPSMLANLFVLDGKWHLALVISMSVLAGLGIVAMSGVIAANASIRFTVEEPWLISLLLNSGPFWSGASAVLLALPTCIYAYRLYDVFDAASRKARNTGALLGLAGAALILAAIYGLPADGWNNAIEKILIALFEFLPIKAEQGFIQNAHLRPGHIVAAAFLCVACVLYAAAFFLFRPTAGKTQREAPALFYILELLLAWSSVFSLLTFSLPPMSG